MQNAEQDYLAVSAQATDAVGAYFAQARLTRQQSRDEAMQLLESACAQADVSQEVVDESMRRINTMAQWSMAESVMETELLARDFKDCVVFAAEDGVTVPAPRSRRLFWQTAITTLRS